MKNFRKEQMKLAVLLEITDKGGKNGEIIKAAESRLIPDDEYNRMMQNGKQTIGNKEMQFVLYYLKKDGIVDVPARGVYVSNELTLAARKTAIEGILNVVDGNDKSEDKIILSSATIKEIREACKPQNLADAKKDFGKEGHDKKLRSPDINLKEKPKKDDNEK